MAKTTTNYGLTKPEKSDNYSVDVMANNMDIIDAKLRNPTTASITNSGTITSTGKITANGGIGTTSLTTSSTITSTGVINANGDIVGQIKVSSVGTNSNNVKVAVVKPSDKSGTRTGSYGVQTISLSSSDLTVTRCNTSFLNCTKTDAELKSAVNNLTATCTIVYTNSDTTTSMSPTVKVVSGSTTVYSQTKTASKGGSATHTFSRKMGTSYTVTIDHMNANDKYSITTDGVSVYTT